MAENKLLKALTGFKRGSNEPQDEPDDQASDDQEPEEEPMDDPRSSDSEGDTLLIDKELFPGGCKVGDKVQITGTVESLGTKFGVVPEGVTAVKNGSDSYGQDQQK